MLTMGRTRSEPYPHTPQPTPVQTRPECFTTTELDRRRPDGCDPRCGTALDPIQPSGHSLLACNPSPARAKTAARSAPRTRRLIAARTRGRLPRLSTGLVRLNPTQWFRGATFFVATSCVAELHELARPIRAAHLMEMSDVAQAMFQAFSPRKLNYEALGNTVPHLHWWLTPRYDDDSRPRAPIWEDLDFLRNLWTHGARPDDKDRDLLKRTLLDALENQSVEIQQRFV